ncbi:MAG: ATP-binding protein, partial [Planctomycetales bacterium]
VHDGAYGPEQMQYLDDREHVRTRFGMYIGDKGDKGLHHLVYEVVDNCIDEAMAGHAGKVFVKINADGSVTVSDDGRGIPTEIHPKLGVSSLEGAMTVLKFGGKFDNEAYGASGGLHGMGVKATNFLSEWCEVEVCRDGHVYEQEYDRGKPVAPVRRIGTTKKTGTKTTFKPDSEVFISTNFNYHMIRKRLQELAFLVPGLKIKLRDERSDMEDDFQYEQGLMAYVKYLNSTSDARHADVLHMVTDMMHQEGDKNLKIRVEIALQYSAEYTENVHSFVNNINTVTGGTHLSGFRTALTRTLNNYGKKNNLFKNSTPTGDDFREGLTAVVSIRHPDPQFESQTKVRCLNTELEGIVGSALGEYLTKYLEEHPKTAKVIVQKAVDAAEAREAARKAKDLMRKKKGAGLGALPGKLRDCSSRDRGKCELYLVEGDSAGGSAEGGRLREYQAILPLRGKIINAYKARESKVLDNEEVRSMISAIGIGVGLELD